jgi:hypothetical protein
MEDNFKVIEYLANNRDHLFDKTSDIRMLKDLSLGSIPQVFHDDVLDQYSEARRKIIVEDIALATNVNTETILILLEDMNIGGYLGE